MWNHSKDELVTENLFSSMGRNKVWLTPKNLGGHVTLTTPPFRKILRGHVRTVPGNIRVKFEVRGFNRFGAISI